jgi:choline-glycine betaine transporter
MSSRSAPIDKQVFWPALIVVVAAIVPLIAFPEKCSEILNQVLGLLTQKLGRSSAR